MDEAVKLVMREVLQIILLWIMGPGMCEFLKICGLWILCTRMELDVRMWKLVKLRGLLLLSRNMGTDVVWAEWAILFGSWMLCIDLKILALRLWDLLKLCGFWMCSQWSTRVRKKLESKMQSLDTTTMCFLWGFLELPTLVLKEYFILWVLHEQMSWKYSLTMWKLLKLHAFWHLCKGMLKGAVVKEGGILLEPGRVFGIWMLGRNMEILNPGWYEFFKLCGIWIMCTIFWIICFWIWLNSTITDRSNVTRGKFLQVVDFCIHLISALEDDINEEEPRELHSFFSSDEVVKEIEPNLEDYVYSGEIRGMIIQSQHDESSQEQCEDKYYNKQWTEVPTTGSLSHQTKIYLSFSNSEVLDESIILAFLEEKWGNNFYDMRKDMHDIRVVEKIGEGGQAEVFQVEVSTEKRKMALKVFKENSIYDIHRQWPATLFKFDNYLVASVKKGVLMKNGRFGVLSKLYDNDLRSIIDIKMLKNGNQGVPPFNDIQAICCMTAIAAGMEVLHEGGILHRDLKAANVLVIMRNVFGDKYADIRCSIADFECSIGICGTGFWRAPEILQDLKDGICPPNQTVEADVYSYAMTCYEILTGKIPLQSHRLSDYEFVIRGGRPTLPNELHPCIYNLITKCWHSNPEERPTFKTIRRMLQQYMILVLHLPKLVVKMATCDPTPVAKQIQKSWTLDLN